MRLLGLSSSIPYFVKQLAAWIDIDQPPSGLDLNNLDNCGYLPERWTAYRYRVVDRYRNAWWEELGLGRAIEMKRWSADVEGAIGEFVEQVIPVFDCEGSIALSAGVDSSSGSRSD